MTMTMPQCHWSMHGTSYSDSGACGLGFGHPATHCSHPTANDWITFAVSSSVFCLRQYFNNSNCNTIKYHMSIQYTTGVIALCLWLQVMGVWPKLAFLRLRLCLRYVSSIIMCDYLTTGASHASHLGCPWAYSSRLSYISSLYMIVYYYRPMDSPSD